MWVQGISVRCEGAGSAVWALGTVNSYSSILVKCLSLRENFWKVQMNGRKKQYPEISQCMRYLWTLDRNSKKYFRAVKIKTKNLTQYSLSLIETSRKLIYIKWTTGKDQEIRIQWKPIWNMNIRIRIMSLQWKYARKTCPENKWKV